MRIKSRGKKSKDIQSTPVEVAQRVLTRPLEGRVTRKNLSRLESLPYEIITQIFLESLNINLPRASPLIGAGLSTKSIYTEFCYRTFLCECWIDLHPGPPTPHSTIPAHSVRNRHEHARTMALQCRWATFRFFQEFLALTERGYAHIHWLFSCDVPAKLFRWPLSADRRNLFFALAASNANFYHIGTLYGERVEALWCSAVEAKDWRLLECLMDRHIKFEPSVMLRRWAVQVTNYDLDMIRLLRLANYKSEHGSIGGLQVLMTSEQSYRAWMEREGEDWPETWPESDPVIVARLYETYAVDRWGLRRLLNLGLKPVRWTWSRPSSSLDCRLWN